MMCSGDRGGNRHTDPVTGLKIGHARVSTDAQDLTAQRDALAALGVAADRVYVDHGLTGTNRDRPGLRQAWRRAGPGTRWWSRNWTGSPGRCLMPARSPTS